MVKEGACHDWTMNCHQNQKNAFFCLVFLMALPDSKSFVQAGLPGGKRASLADGADWDDPREAEGAEEAEWLRWLQQCLLLSCL